MQPSVTAIRRPHGSVQFRHDDVDGDGAATAKLRQQISHDVKHELSTIMLLASVLIDGDDIGEVSRSRARQILGETRWLHQLLQAYDNLAISDIAVPNPSEPIRLDVLAGDVVSSIQLSSFTRVSLHAEPTCAHIDKLAFWRVLRNVVANAVCAAGPEGAVEVRIQNDRGWAVVEVDDDGPGFDSAQLSASSLGLGIVQELMSAWGGELEIRRGNLGGCRIRLRLPLSQQVSDVRSVSDI